MDCFNRYITLQNWWQVVFNCKKKPCWNMWLSKKLAVSAIIVFANLNEVHKQIVVVSSELMLSIAAHYSISSVGTVSHTQSHIYAKHGCQPHRLIGCYYHYARRKCAKLMNAASRCLERWQPPNDEVSSTCKLWCNYYLQQNTLSHRGEWWCKNLFSKIQSHSVLFPLSGFICWCVIRSTGQLACVCVSVCVLFRVDPQCSRVQKFTKTGTPQDYACKYCTKLLKQDLDDFCAVLAVSPKCSVIVEGYFHMVYSSLQLMFLMS